LPCGNGPVSLGRMTTPDSEISWDDAFFGPLFAGHETDASHLEPFLGGWMFADDQGALAIKLTRTYLERLDERSEPERFRYEVLRSAPGLIHIRTTGDVDEIEDEQIMECKDRVLCCFDDEGERLEKFRRVEDFGPYQPKELEIGDSPVFESMPEQAARMKVIHAQHEERTQQYVDRLLEEAGYVAPPPPLKSSE